MVTSEIRLEDHSAPEHHGTGNGWLQPNGIDQALTRAFMGLCGHIAQCLCIMIGIIWGCMSPWVEDIVLDRRSVAEASAAPTGFATVIGADKLTRRQPMWGEMAMPMC